MSKFSLVDLVNEYEFSAENILSMADKILSEDEVALVLYNILNDYDCNIPDELAEYYNCHCK